MESSVAGRVAGRLRALVGLREGRAGWIAAALAALIITLVQYGGALNQPFDSGEASMGGIDTRVMLERVRAHPGLGQIFGPWDPPVYYRPVMMLYLAVLYRLFGERALAFHIAGLLVHMGVVLMVGVVAWRASRMRAVAMLAMVGYALLGRHRLAVTWVCANVEPLVAVFYLGALAALVSERRRGWLWALPLGALALGTKEMAVTLPLLATAWVAALRKWERWLALAGLWALLLAYLGLRHHIIGHIFPEHGFAVPLRQSLSVYLSFLADPVVALAMAPRMFAPSVLVLMDPSLWYFVAREAGFWLGACVLIRRRLRVAAMFFLWKVIVYLPAMQYLTDLRSDRRYLYLPDVGNALLLGLAIKEGWELLRERLRRAPAEEPAAG